MRTIKFRGKDIETGEWIYGHFFQRLGHYPAITEPRPRDGKVMYYEIAVEDKTVGQFTGLLDKKGKEIYEGDIIFSQKCDCRAILHKVEYNVDNAMFVAKPIQGWDFDFCQIRKDWIEKYGKEVIGNIHDNPELLKGGHDDK